MPAPEKKPPLLPHWIKFLLGGIVSLQLAILSIIGAIEMTRTSFEFFFFAQAVLLVVGGIVLFIAAAETRDKSRY